MGAQLQMTTPEFKEVVTQAILRVQGLNVTAFSGSDNPSSLYRRLVSNGPDVFPLLREIEDKDEAAGSALELRRSKVLSKPWDVKQADEKNDRAKFYAEETRAMLERIPQFQFALREALDARGYGYSVVEIIWGIRDGRVIPLRLIGRPQELFRFNPLIEPQTGPLMLREGLGFDLQPVPPNKFIVSTFEPRHGDRRGLPLLRKIFWASWFKRNILRFYLRHLEKGDGTVVVKYPQGAADDEQKNALVAAEAIADEIAAAIPQNFELLGEALTQSRPRQGDLFQKGIDYFDAGIRRRILGQTMTTQGAEAGAGSRAMGDVHADTEEDFLKPDAIDLEEAIQSQLVNPWGVFNFGPDFLRDEFRPRWEIEKEPPEDAAAALGNIQTAHQMGVPVPTAEVYERGQIRAPEEGEAVLPASPVTSDLGLPPLPVPPEAGPSPTEEEPFA